MGWSKVLNYQRQRRLQKYGPSPRVRDRRRCLNELTPLRGGGKRVPDSPTRPVGRGTAKQNSGKTASLACYEYVSIEVDLLMNT